jgi:hypothetical protein
MISVTPRMQSALLDHPDAGFAKIWKVGCDIELELNAANERIKMLEEDLMDAKNQYAVLVADVVLYEDRGERIKRLDETLEAVTDKIDNAWGIYMKFKEAKP